MAEFNIPDTGTICWRENATKDLAKATDFYSQMFGWTIEQSKVTPMAYKEIHIDGKACGGMMAIDENWGPEPPPSFWQSYVAVHNADATCEKITANGGTVKHGPFDAPGIGRMAMVMDPSGAHFAVIQFTQPS
jgi:predicted enzyme related to lactoylglutathione lyase